MTGGRQRRTGWRLRHLVVSYNAPQFRPRGNVFVRIAVTVSTLIVAAFSAAAIADQPVEISYSTEKMAAGREKIHTLLQEIRAKSEIVDFPLTPDFNKCKFCVYRSLCDRGESAGMHPDLDYEADANFDLDFDQIQEIEF